ncbi:sugar ABC transporter substrate-binding protein [Kribbella sp. NPDC051620]|uniref:sugar ABC transporter substrate-binding protein n=1 Tax=Kribbella sp. NPDC051620 TaxID=3364120 RepID=UPI0037ADF24F
MAANPHAAVWLLRQRQGKRPVLAFEATFSPRWFGPAFPREFPMKWMRCSGAGATTVAVTLALISLAGCGAASTAQGSGNNAEAAKAAAAADAELQTLYKGTNATPPASTSPVRDGANVFVVGDMAVSATAAAVASVVAAGKIAGWHVKTWDGKAQSSQQLAGIRTAVSQRADAIFVYGVDCAGVKPGLEEAKAAGIPVVAGQAYDCSDVAAGAPSLFTYRVDYVMGQLPSFSKAWGAAQATYLISKLKGDARVLNIVETDYQVTVVQSQGFEARLAQCGSCKIVDTVKFTAAEFGPPLQQKIAQALLRHPDANATSVPYDAVLTGGVLGAIRDAGGVGKVLVAGGEGQPEGISLVRSGEVAAEFGTSTPWEGWAAAEAINRLLAGAKPQPSGIGIQVVDKEHNLPAAGGFTSSVDFEGIYTKAFRDAVAK